jgi:predicted esterase
MRYFIRFIPFILIVCFFSATPALSQSAEDSKFIRKGFANWPDIDSIDIYDENAGEFLDINLNIFKKKAAVSYQAKQYEAAAKYYLILAQHDVHDTISIYNLACCYGLLGEVDQAAKFLIRACRAGFDDIEFIKNDKDFDNVRGNRDFDDVMKALEAKLNKKHDSFGDIHYSNQNTLLKYRVYLPENYNPKKSYPLVVGLHGFSGTADQFVRYGSEFEDTEMIYVAPQAPFAVKSASGIGYSWVLFDDKELVYKSGKLSSRYICDIVKDIKTQYNVDSTYLFGFSQGCIMSYVIGIKNHEIFDGLICFGGWLEDELISDDEIEEANDLKVFISQGDVDNALQNGGGQGAYDTLKKHGYDVEYHKFHGGHFIPDTALNAAEEWMF